MQSGDTKETKPNKHAHGLHRMARQGFLPTFICDEQKSGELTDYLPLWLCCALSAAVVLFFFFASRHIVIFALSFLCSQSCSLCCDGEADSCAFQWSWHLWSANVSVYAVKLRSSRLSSANFLFLSVAPTGIWGNSSHQRYAEQNRRGLWVSEELLDILGYSSTGELLVYL